MTIHYRRQKGIGLFGQIGLIVMLSALAILATAAAQAQEPTRGRWWQSPDIVQQLELTEAEIQQLDEAFDAAELKMIELRSNVAVEKTRLRALLEQSEIDEAAIFRQHQSERAARTLLSDERLAFLIKTRKIIGQERFIKLMEIRDAQRRYRFMEKPEGSKPMQ